MVKVENLSKSFGKLEVIKDVSFSVEKGQVLGIIGPSGSGKSTMMRCINQLETVSGGTIQICGETLVKDGVYADKKKLREIGLHSGLVFQNFNLFPHFSVLKNITEAQIHVLKRNKAEAEEVARKLLGKMGLQDKEVSYPCELSGGQQQRVSIARALALNPDILFFDEPTSALDPELTGEILKVIRELADEKMTMVVVTHEMAFARDLCDTIIFMDGGVIVEQGKATDLINNPQNERTKVFLSKY
ncbi:MAG: amino acid ABC transporter ATP-binding protein [Spirochaetaceae bacterium]|nr:amino acid ABC transporter ATP-binding protein [Spirochaetaceae bacterium]